MDAPEQKAKCQDSIMALVQAEGGGTGCQA